MRPVLSHGGEAAATIPAMNAALRTTLGWVAAVLLNLGAVLFVVGLIVPRSGDVSVLEIGIAMLVGRFFMIIPMLAIAGNLASKKIVPPSLGTFPVTTPLFTTLLVSVIVIVGALTFFPALSLGPVVEHLLLYE